jgi:hydrogenase expression/formation protein HypD
MAIKHMEEYRDAGISRGLIQQIQRVRIRPIRLMEVCGTHTVSIFRNGIRSLLPDTITLLSGPGCPVCVTDQSEIDAFIALAKIEDVIITTFGDLMRVPGTMSSLQKERANGHDIRVVYSIMDALDIAEKHPHKPVVFLGVGFETTAPTIAAAVADAKRMKLKNFFVYSAHKRVPPALEALMSIDAIRIDGFILPGHVSVITGLKAYQPFFDRHHVPCVVSGFEPADILQTIWLLVQQIEQNRPALGNAYGRAVTDEGNTKACALMEEVFTITDVAWRGIGVIPQSGLKIRDAFSAFDAEKAFSIDISESESPKGCACGEILTGIKTPPECPLYKTVCTPMDPVGPCMVSSEGTCAAYYKYHN